MGFYDRDYYRDDNPYNDYGGHGMHHWRIVTWILVINIGLWLIDAILFPTRMTPLGPVGHDLTLALSLTSESLFHPLQWYRFLTYGFVHSTGNYWHILSNMIVLFFLGYAVEDKLGRWEFLRFYLISIIFSALVFAVSHWGREYLLLGASGGVTAVVILFILYYPHQILLLFGIIPIPAWLLGVFMIGSDILGVMNLRKDNIAFMAHLGGAAFALAYAYMGIHFSFLTAPWRRLKDWSRRRPRNTFKVYRPPEENDEELNRRVDEILKKCSEHGEGSLTREERDFLIRAGRTYRKKHRD